jgi:hypothetical protein
LNWLARHWASGIRLALEIAAGGAAYFGGFELITHFVHAADWKTVWAQAYVVATAIILLTVLIFREYTAGRKEKYANITSHVQKITLLCKELVLYVEERRPPNGANREQYKQFTEACHSKFALVLDQLNLVFSSLTSTKCRTSIKVIYERGGEFYYYTLARDAGCWNECLESDNRRVDNDHDPVKNNSHFLTIFDSSTHTYHYISNDLTRDSSFHSTSFTIYDPHWADTGAKPRSLLTRLKGEWPLPYRSTIAVAIRLGASSFLTEVKPTVLGFLTIDSESRNVFEERWDVQLMFAAADALFHPLRAFLEIQNKAPTV